MCMSSLCHIVRFRGPGKDLGTRVAQKVGSMGGGMLEPVGFPWSTHRERPYHLSELAHRLRECLCLLSHQCLESISAGQAPLEAISEYSQHLRVCGFWTNYTLFPLSTINHTGIVAFINIGQEAKIELLGWYQTKTKNYEKPWKWKIYSV